MSKDTIEKVETPSKSDQSRDEKEEEESNYSSKNGNNDLDVDFKALSLTPNSKHLTKKVVFNEKYIKESKYQRNPL